MEGDALVNSYVSFVDARHFGTVRFVYGHDALQAKLACMMWDLLERPASTTAVWWYLRAKKNDSLRQKQVSVALMNQHVFPGIGNYLRAEILYASKVSPMRLLEDVTYEELDAILKNAREIMLRSYESGGATIATYRDAEGNKGSAQARFACYGRKQDPLGNPVIREKTSDGRTIHWVKEVQK
jgi:formamidopyrimidine-DNA glycosylase